LWAKRKLVVTEEARHQKWCLVSLLRVLHFKSPN
jgi:hypothetical protein